MSPIAAALVAATLILASNANEATAPAAPQARPPQAVAIPSGVTVEPIATWDQARLERIMTTELVENGFGVAGCFPHQAPTTGVRLYRMTYPSVIPELHNRPTVATGLVAIPEKPLPGTPIVCYQHGTVFSKDEVPSNPENSTETRLMVAQFAGHGYVVVAADYFGKGGSAEGDSYLVKASTQQACVDMLFTAKALLGAMGIAPGPLFLSGWSQGGWATLVLLQHLESLGAPVAATATASAPCDVYTTVSRWINNPQPIDTPWLTGVCALQLNAQEHYLQPGLVDVAIKPQYVQACRDLYANRIGWPEFSTRVPKLVRDMLTPAFVESSRMAESDYWRRLQDAQGYRWRACTPIHVYWGAKDEVVPPFIAQLPEGFQRIVGGAPTQAIPAGDEADHRGTFLFAARHQKAWFDGILSGMTGAK
jgi:pimeloyl-ACP methyl ester carboxylesterase